MGKVATAARSGSFLWSAHYSNFAPTGNDFSGSKAKQVCIINIPEWTPTQELKISAETK